MLINEETMRNHEKYNARAAERSRISRLISSKVLKVTSITNIHKGNECNGAIILDFNVTFFKIKCQSCQNVLFDKVNITAAES